jgi:hypothetical protein
MFGQLGGDALFSGSKRVHDYTYISRQVGDVRKRLYCEGCIHIRLVNSNAIQEGTRGYAKLGNVRTNGRVAGLPPRGSLVPPNMNHVWATNALESGLPLASESSILLSSSQSKSTPLTLLQFSPILNPARHCRDLKVSSHLGASIKGLQQQSSIVQPGA